MNNKIEVDLISVLGTDETIVEAARVSVNNKGKSTTEQLIRYLYKHKHMSPFEFPIMCFNIRCPIFVARQMFRHRTHSASEISARYVEYDECSFYVFDDLRVDSKVNKQSSVESTIPPETTKYLLEIIYEHNEQAFSLYNELRARGVAKEIARTVLPLATMTQFRWQMNLRNLIHFCELRDHPDAQLEIRIVAEQIKEYIKDKFPIVYKTVFVNGLYI